MAASMIRKGIASAHVLCITQNDFGVLLRLQKPMCRYKTKTATTIIPDFLKPEGKQKKHDLPIHSIYLLKDYPKLKFRLEDGIAMHKEAAQPEMTNTLNKQLYADIQLNFSTNKKTKFMKNICGLLEFPHSFDHQQKKSIFVFTESQQDQELCQNLGAVYVGGDDLIGLFNQGILRKDDVILSDFMFSSPGMAVKLLKLRPMLMDRMPTLNNGRITNDLEAAVKQHMKGVTYKSRKESDPVGRTQVPFGLLEQDTDILIENFSFMVSKLLEIKPKNQVPLVESVRLIAPPSTEIFQIEIGEYLSSSVGGGNKQTEEDSDSDED